MQYDHLERTLQDSIALKLLGSQHAPLILSFLHQQFKQQHQLTIFHSLLVERLEDYLAALREMGEAAYETSYQRVRPTTSFCAMPCKPSFADDGRSDAEPI